MPSVIQLEDKPTLKVLRALFSGAYEFSVKKIQSSTNLSKSVVNNRLNFLLKNKILTGIQPSLNVVECGLTTAVLSFMNFDLSKRTTLASLEKTAIADPYMFYFGELCSYTGFNKYALQLYHNLGEWDNHTSETYWGVIENMYEFVRDRVLIFVPLDRLLKHTDISRCVVGLIAENGGKNPKLNDPATVSILKALFEDVYEVSYKKIQSIVKMSKSVIHGRLDFLKENGYIGAPTPLLSALKCGFMCKVYNFLTFEKDRKELYKKLSEMASRDPHIFHFGDVLEHNFNTCLCGIYRNDIEWQKSLKGYFDAVPELYDAVTNRLSMVIPLNFVQKEQSIQLTALNILERDKG